MWQCHGPKVWSRHQASPGIGFACTITHHLHSLENAIAVDRIPANCIYSHVRLKVKVQPFRVVWIWKIILYLCWYNVIMTWIITIQRGRATLVQIDCKDNWSGLREAFYSFNHSFTLKNKILELLTHSNNRTNIQGEGGQIGGGQTESFNKEHVDTGLGRDFPKCSNSSFWQQYFHCLGKWACNEPCNTNTGLV